MSLCACGCGNTTKGGTFQPGHDAKMRAAIEQSVGGLFPLYRLVDAARRFADGELSAQDYQRLTHELIESKHQRGNQM